MAAAARTGAIRLIIATAPSRIWIERGALLFPPPATVSRLVPSVSRVRCRSARPAAEMPTTDSMAAMPMAMPSADRVARKGRVRRPTAPTRSTSSAASRPGAHRSGADRRRAGAVALIGSPAPPSPGPDSSGHPDDQPGGDAGSADLDVAVGEQSGGHAHDMRGTALDD